MSLDHRRDDRSVRLRAVLRAVCRRLTFGSTTVLYECRRCGANLEGGGTSCQHCGRTDAVRYEF